MNSELPSSRLEQHEELLMHLQNDLEQMNSVILGQQTEIQELQNRIVRLEGRVDASSSSDEPPRTLEDDIPPHY